LREKSDLTIVEVQEIDKLSNFDGKILSCLKLRTIDRHLNRIADVTSGREVYIYEQDPWESFYDVAACPGSYERITERIKPVSFLNTSKWWSDLIRSKGIQSRFVKMWVLPEYCGYSISHEKREISTGFMGSMHTYRITALENMRRVGVNPEILKFTGVYKDYLRAIGGMRMFIHDEPNRWMMGGSVIPCNALWGKDVEPMSQGTFCLRNREDEAEAYGLRDNPLLIEYGSYEEMADKISDNLKLSPDETDLLARKGVDMIREDAGWNTVIESMI